MFKSYFEGWYFKFQNKTQTVSIIPGISCDKAFIQIITDKDSYNVNYKRLEFKKDKKILVGNSIFSFDEIKLDINTKELIALGKINCYSLTPLNSDIMGPFRFLPSECRHSIISMHHKLSGKLEINGEIFDFANGIGYIEKDRGYSFPKRYAWIHSNDFNEKCSIMVAVASVPFLGFEFEGIICAVYYRKKEYRIATYNGAKVIKCNKNEIQIANKNFIMQIEISDYKTHDLFSPIKGKMNGVIKESPSCTARFKFFENNRLVFDVKSSKTSCEFVDY